jgi:hypothetical protein
MDTQAAGHGLPSRSTSVRNQTLSRLPPNGHFQLRPSRLLDSVTILRRPVLQITTARSSRRRSPTGMAPTPYYGSHLLWDQPTMLT